MQNHDRDNRDIATLLGQARQTLLDEWMDALKQNAVRQDNTIEISMRQHCTQFLDLLLPAIRQGGMDRIDSPEWAEMRALLQEVSQTRARQGSTPSETAVFVFSLKQPLFAQLRSGFADDPARLADATWTVSTLLDRLGLFTVETFQKSREQIIARQQQELLELSTPVVKLWKDVLALPLIGTLDSARTQIVMESLLQKIVETGASIAIIDITGVPTVDTLVAQHLLKAVAAARLMGADCIISGIRPQIAQTIVHLGVNLEDVVTKATLADAFVLALKRTGSAISSAAD